MRTKRALDMNESSMLKIIHQPRQPFWRRKGFESVESAIEGNAYCPGMRPHRSDFEHRETFQPKFGYKAAMNAYWREAKALELEFKLDVLHDCGISPEHPKADLLYKLASDQSHGSGHLDLLNLAREMSELLK